MLREIPPVKLEIKCHCGAYFEGMPPEEHRIKCLPWLVNPHINWKEVRITADVQPMYPVEYVTVSYDLDT